jgi:hypothetical protein
VPKSHLRPELDAAYQWRALVFERCTRLGHPMPDYGHGIGICVCGARMQMNIEHKTYSLGLDEPPSFKDPGVTPAALLAEFG